jgi:hypothetical protein
VGYRTYQGRKQMKEKSPLRQKDIRTGAQQERERIIALIEAKDEWHYAFSDVSDIIALIKGEK